MTTLMPERFETVVLYEYIYKISVGRRVVHKRLDDLSAEMLLSVAITKYIIRVRHARPTRLLPMEASI